MNLEDRVVTPLGKTAKVVELGLKSDGIERVRLEYDGVFKGDGEVLLQPHQLRILSPRKP